MPNKFFCGVDSDLYYFSLSYRENINKYYIDMSDCEEHLFKKLSNAYTYIFKWLNNSLIDYQFYNNYGGYKEEIDDDNILNRCYLTESKYINKIVIKYATRNNILFVTHPKYIDTIFLLTNEIFNEIKRKVHIKIYINEDEYVEDGEDDEDDDEDEDDEDDN